MKKEKAISWKTKRSLFCLSAVAAVVLHEEIMLLIQIISGIVQGFTETLEMHDFPFPQETQRCKHIRIIRQVDEVFIGAARFLLCCVGVRAKFALEDFLYQKHIAHRSDEHAENGVSFP